MTKQEQLIKEQIEKLLDQAEVFAKYEYGWHPWGRGNPPKKDVVATVKDLCRKLPEALGGWGYRYEMDIQFDGQLKVTVRGRPLRGKLDAVCCSNDYWCTWRHYKKGSCDNQFGLTTDGAVKHLQRVAEREALLKQLLSLGVNPLVVDDLEMCWSAQDQASTLYGKRYKGKPLKPKIYNVT